MQISNKSSEVKWREFLQGDEQAYSWLYRTYVQLLYNYGSHFTMDHELIKIVFRKFLRGYIRIEKHSHYPIMLGFIC